jgi:hypothetical protein
VSNPVTFKPASFAKFGKNSFFKKVSKNRIRGGDIGFPGEVMVEIFGEPMSSIAL